MAKVCTRTIFDVLGQANLSLDAEHPMSCHYPVKRYHDYFKFGFVRNPWDRLVSCWRNKVVDSNYFGLPDNQHRQLQSFDNFVSFVTDQDLEHCDHHIRLQASLIDMNAVDFVGRFESFEADLLKVAQRLNLGSVSIGKKNSSVRNSDYRREYSEVSANKIEIAYSRDINLFQYEF